MLGKSRRTCTHIHRGNERRVELAQPWSQGMDQKERVGTPHKKDEVIGYDLSAVLVKST